jgi:hypothetical protein
MKIDTFFAELNPLNFGKTLTADSIPGSMEP